VAADYRPECCELGPAAGLTALAVAAEQRPDAASSDRPPA
jgi:hypothetical protein